jgi:hypothetical protein
MGILVSLDAQTITLSLNWYEIKKTTQKAKNSTLFNW